MFVEVAMATGEKILVSGNTRRFPAKKTAPVKVLSPTAAWSRLCTES